MPPGGSEKGLDARPDSPRVWRHVSPMSEGPERWSGEESGGEEEWSDAARRDHGIAPWKAARLAGMAGWASPFFLKSAPISGKGGID